MSRYLEDTERSRQTYRHVDEIHRLEADACIHSRTCRTSSEQTNSSDPSGSACSSLPVDDSDDSDYWD
jgi:hypothetical protein